MNKIAILALIAISVSSVAIAADKNDSSFVENPPVFFDNERDIPLSSISMPIPPPGVIAPDFDIGQFDSDGFVNGGQPVQPGLSVQTGDIRLSGFRGFSKGWAAGLSLPWYRVKVANAIGGLPASGIAEGMGDISLLGKMNLRSNGDRNYLNLVGGFELPSGKDDSVFSQSNRVTNAYYSNDPQRMPISWQPGSGSVNGYLGLVYGKRGRYISYAATLLGKMFTPGDEDVKIGNILIFAGSGTYGINRNLAVSLGFILRSQADDDYPNAPSPGVGQPALAGTTTHGTTLFLDPSVRFRVLNRLIIGYGLRFPISKPNDGMVPDTRVFLIFYPEF